MKIKNGLLCIALLISCAILFGGCGSNKNTANSNRADEVNKMNLSNISLLNQIRRIRGITVQGGIPILNKANSSFVGTAEPLYVVNDFIVGSSFSSVKEVVNPIDVESIKVLQGADASFYGSRGANGVIVIKTKT